MRRFVASLAWVSLVATAAPTFAGNEPPPLAPPALSGPVAEPPAELPKSIGGSPLPGNRPVLVVPGFARPRPAARTPRTTPGPVPPVTGAPGGSPALVGPAEMPAPVAGIERPAPPASEPAEPVTDSTPPITLESIPGEPDDGTTPTTRTPTRRTAPEPRTSSPPRRPPGFFGRFFPPSSRDRGAANLRDPVTNEPKTDPAADAAVKRQVERQIRANLGGRVRSFEVRIVGREVIIRARAARYFQRRGVRHDLEALPVLSGYRTNVELID